MLKALSRSRKNRDPLDIVRKSLDALASNDMTAATTNLSEAHAATPDSAPVMHALALAALRLAEPGKALEMLQRAHETAPEAREHVDCLAILHARLGRLHDSLYFAKLGSALERAYPTIELNPPWLGEYAGNLAAIVERPLLNEANAHMNVGDFHGAAELYRKDVEINRRSVPSWRGLALAMRRSGRPLQALVAHQALRALEPQSAEDLSALAATLAQCGRFEEALACHERVVRMEPEQRELHSAMLADLACHPSIRRGDLAERQRIWGRGAPPAFGDAPVPKVIDERPLRVGFLSGRFLEGKGLDTILSLLAVPRRPLWEAHCYSNAPYDDGVTRRLRNLADGWRDIGELDDDTAALIIRNDALDVLIDLDGHREYGRPAIALLRPAARCMSLFGLPEAAAEQGFDGVVGDNWTYPTDSENADTIIRVPSGLLRIPADRLLNPANEARSDRPIAFGSRACRMAITADVVALWADVLAAVPESTLVLDPERLGGASAMNEIAAQLSWYGLAGRLRSVGADGEEEAAAWNSVDIVLDAGLSSSLDDAVDALCLGKPVITLVADRPERRAVASLLASLEFEEFTATDPTQYVAIAARLGGDPAALAEISSRIIDRIKVAQANFTRDGAADFGRALGRWLNTRAS